MKDLVENDILGSATFDVVKNLHGCWDNSDSVDGGEQVIAVVVMTAGTSVKRKKSFQG